jgi:hypothetical protein
VPLCERSHPMVPAKTGFRCEICARERHAEIMRIRAKYLPGGGAGQRFQAIQQTEEERIAQRNVELQALMDGAPIDPASGRVAAGAEVPAAVEETVVEPREETQVSVPQCERHGSKHQNGRGYWICSSCLSEAVSKAKAKKRGMVVTDDVDFPVTRKAVPLVTPKPKAVRRAGPKPRKPDLLVGTSDDIVGAAQLVADLATQLVAAKAHLRELLDA